MPFATTVWRWLRGFGWRRSLTHAALLLVTIGSVFVVKLYQPQVGAIYMLSLGCGYLSLCLIVVTLSIGTVQLLRKPHLRRNPVNLNLRRDIGIWAGITGVVHVIFALQVYLGGRRPLFYFIQWTPDGYRLLGNLFGFNNYVGAAATVVLVLLTAISNDYSLRRLRGKRWKNLQRWNYPLAVLVIVHTFGYQMLANRESPFVVGVVLITILFVVVQIAGIIIFRIRANRLLARHSRLYQCRN